MSRAGKLWVRRITALSMAFLVVVVAAMAVNRARRIMASRGQSGTPFDSIVDAALETAQSVYRGQSVKETVAGKLIFELTSERTLGTEGGWHELEGFRLQFHRDGDEGPTITADGASYNVKTRDARLRGNLRVDLGDGGQLTTDTGRFSARDRVFIADSPVTFTDGSAIGTAGRATFSVEDERLLLSDGIVLRTTEGTTLTAEKIVYLRDEGLLLFPEGLTIKGVGAELQAPSGRVELDSESGKPERIGLTGGVVARSGSGPAGTLIDASMPTMVAVADAGGGWQVVATTTGPWIRLVMSGGESFLQRALWTVSLRASVGPEGPRNLRAEGGVCLREVPFEGPLRLAEAERARMWFVDGQATDVELQERVEMSGDGIVARGQRARVSASTHQIILQGDPVGTDRASLVTSSARLTADQVRLVEVDGRAEARGNVQGSMINASLVGSGDRTTDDVHFAADSLDVEDGGNVFHMETTARAWQGRQLLLADDIVYHRVDQSLAAKGHVRTTFPARQVDANATVNDDDDVVVVARMLDYSREKRLAVYRGGVHYTDPAHILSANELTVHFDETNKISNVEATGVVEIVDLETGRKMRGDSVTRDASTGLVEMEGTPAQLTDEKGNVVSGSSLTWDQASGTVSVAGGTETIYHPEDAP